jgi:drug/metabolite transporter (DMT)-like permease
MKMMEQIIVIAITLISAMMVAVAQYIFKKNMPIFHINMKGIKDIIYNKNLLLGIFIYFIALAVYLVALHYGQLSYVYPIFASSFIFIILISKYAIKETTDWKRIIGILLIVLGITIVALT